MLNTIVKTIEKDINDFGFVGATQQAVKRSGTKLKITRPVETRKILQNKPVVIAANHPFEVEPIVLISSLPKRNDIYLIINAAFTGLIKKLDENLIPVYINHHRGKSNNLKRWSGVTIDKYHPMPLLRPEEAQRRNRESIKYAANLVKKGGIVIIFPDRRSLSGVWFSGIGHLLNTIGKAKETHYVKAFVGGTSNWDYLRIIPNLGKVLPKVHVHFSEAQEIKKVLSYDKDPKKITAQLEHEYNQWVEGLAK